jgi:NCAIR mutase (PurE)-related protein
MLTLTQAAKEVGKTRSALFKAIKTGRLSGAKDAQGHFVIDPAELYRVYSGNAEQVDTRKQQETAKETMETAFLRRENELLRQQIERERDQIADLKTDRDEWRKQATMLLTHQPEPQPNTTGKNESSALWRKLFGKR